MPDEDAEAVIFFVASLYAVGIVILYVLARAWEQALSRRPDTKRGSVQARDIHRPGGF